MPDKAETRDRELKQKDWVSHLIANAQTKKWYGKITIVIERGDIRLVKKEENLKPPS